MAGAELNNTIYPQESDNISAASTNYKQIIIMHQIQLLYFYNFS